MAFGSRAQNLVVRLSVEDAEKARQALRSFGAEGDKALRQIEKATVPASRGLKVLDAGVAGVAKSIRGPLLAAVAGVVGVGALGAFGKSTFAAADSLKDMADRLGLTVESLQELRYAAKQAGVEQQTFDIAIQRLGRRMGEIARGQGKEYVSAFEQLGVSVFKADGRLKSVEEVLPELADGLSKVTDQGVRMALMQKLVDSEGVALVVALQEGSAALDRQREAARRLGIVWSEEMVTAAAEASDRIDDLGQVIDMRFGAALLRAAPLVEDFANVSLKVLGESLDWVGDRWEALTRDMNAWSRGHIEAEIAKAGEEIAALQARRDSLAERAAPGARGVSGIARAAASGQLQDAQRELQAAMDRLAELQIALTAAEDAEGKRADARKRRLAELAAAGGGSPGRTPGEAKDAEDRAKALEKVLTTTRGWADAHAADVKEATENVAKLQEAVAMAAASPMAAARLEMQKENRRLEDDYRKGLLNAKQYSDGLAATAFGFQQKLAEAATEAEKKAAEEREKIFGRTARQEVDSYFDTLARSGERAGQFLVNQFQSVEDTLTQTFLTGKFSASSFFDSVKAGLARMAAQDLVSGVGGLFGMGGNQARGGTVTGSILSGLAGGAASSIGSAVAGFFGFSSGGLVMGPGTGTSDSVDRGVRVSRGEYIVNAEATRHYLPLLRRINRQGLPGGATHRRRGGGRRGFAWGGLDGEGFDSGWGGLDGNMATDDAYAGASWDAESSDAMATDYRGALYNEFDKEGNIVDRRGGSIVDKIGTFFGQGTDAGFIGSRAAGVLVSLGAAALTGPLGFLAGGAVKTGINLAREFATGGLAYNGPGGLRGLIDPFSGGTGIAGSLYDDFAGRGSIAQRIDAALGLRGASKNLGPGSLPGRVTGGGGTVSENAAAIAGALRELGFGNDGDSQVQAELLREMKAQARRTEELLRLMAMGSGSGGGISQRRTAGAF